MRKLYYVEAGQPSYQMLSREAERILAEADEESDWLRSLPRATACDLISGKSKRTPDWLLVRTLVVVCHHIATKSNLDIAPQAALIKEFGQLWQAAKEEEEGGSRASPAYVAMHGCSEEPRSDQITGDVLDPAPGEGPSRRTTSPTGRIPGSWGRLGSRRLKQAEDGDAQAAYEVAVLLACEAIGLESSGRDPEEVAYWRAEAAVWKGRATGKIPEAAALRLQGLQLVNAAYELAIRYKKAGRAGSKDFFIAAMQAESSVGGLNQETSTSSSADESVVVDPRDEAWL
ncbi:hypothetical protein E1295_45430 [Nonomuraea mesophila]|uniref:Uncharacterized protein n=1 Tax=Nonomuraea mesophila TaxID=2530382 RepID=A0A4R5E4W9_9ACTN|nr:hypothetical protein [Nonomuraea mesophila]TDE24059.1 hypothetical protein E1295_45430 [Nonomuraea mesophila]